MRECGECRFCCWSFAVHDVPQEIKGIENKPALTNCWQECDGCAIHERADYPPMCKTFICPYLRGDEIHRPDKFQVTLNEAGGNIGNYIPTVPLEFNVESANILIRSERCLPAAILINNEWQQVILPLDRDSEGNWEPVTNSSWNE